jgi:hypothetical protein
MNRILLLWLLLVGLTASAATTYYVAPNGSSTNSGLSSGAPWPLQHALDNCGDNNTVILASGTYTNTSATGPEFYHHTYSGVILKAATKWGPIITTSHTFSDSYGMQCWKSTVLSNLTFDGLTFSNCYQDGLKLHGHHMTVRNCYITHNGSTTDGNGIGAMSDSPHDNLFEGNLIETSGNGAGFGHAIYYSGFNNIVRNNVIRHNTAFGIHQYVSGGSDIQHNNHIYNNLVYGHANRAGIVIYGAREGGAGAGTNYIYGNTVMDVIECDYGTACVTNNIILRETGYNSQSQALWSNGNRPATLRENYNLSNQSLGGGDHDVNATYNGATWFANTNNSLYWILSGSPAKAVALSTVYGPVDFFGTSRSSVADIGFNQYSNTYAADTRNLTGAAANFWLGLTVNTNTVRIGNLNFVRP